MPARKQSIIPAAWVRSPRECKRKRKRIVISDDEGDRALFELDVDMWVLILRFLPSSVKPMIVIYLLSL